MCVREYVFVCVYTYIWEWSVGLESKYVRVCVCVYASGVLGWKEKDTHTHENHTNSLCFSLFPTQSTLCTNAHKSKHLSKHN